MMKLLECLSILSGNYPCYFKLKMLRLLAPILLLLCSCQQQSIEELSIREYQKDLEYLLKTLETVHPNMYSLVSKNDFNNKVIHVKQCIESKPNRTEFNLQITSLVASINDDHTQANLSIEDLMKNIEFNQLRVLPFYIKVLDTMLFVVEDFSTNQVIPAGTKIISINNIPAYNIIDSLSHYISCERVYPKRALLSDQFSLYYHYVFGFSDEYSIDYLDINNKLCHLSCKGLDFEQIQLANRNIPLPSNEIKLYPDIDSSYLVVDIPTFGYQNKTDYLNNLDSIFNEINMLEQSDLIIDISNNGGGGSQNVEYLLEYIANKPYRLFDSCVIKISKANQSEYPLEYRTKLRKVGVALYAEKIAVKKLPNRINSFKGNLYLIVGPKTFSSACAMASAFQCSNLGTIIGEETGGLTATYGDISSFKLPHSGIEFYISTKFLVQACGKPDLHGVIPDMLIKRTIYDELNVINYYKTIIDSLKNSNSFLKKNNKI
jgi:hypothetical protein